LLSEEESLDESNPIYRYFIVKDNSKIGYADINMSVSSNIGIVLLKKYRSMGLGKVVFSKLLEEAYNKGLDDIVVATDKDNVKMRGLCEKMGGILDGVDGHAIYWFKKKKKIYKM
jgi:predicted acetyltransferase